MTLPSPAVPESCDFCRAALGEGHQHLLESQSHRIECACDACAILFSGTRQKYKRIPRRIRQIADFQITDAEWDALAIPVGLAFFVNDGTGKVAAFYPSPAGAVESLLSMDAWQSIAQRNPDVRNIEPDVEALLASRVRPATNYFIVPIDECFRLIGIVRLNWKGFSGGPRVWSETNRFLERLQQRSSR